MEHMTESKRYALMRIPIFEKLSYDEMEIVGKDVRSLPFKAGDVILKEGSHGTSMFFVVDGILEVVKQKEKVDDENVVIATVSSGQSVGEMALVDGFVRSATVLVKTDGSLLTLKREDFELLQEKHPEIGIKILKGISSLISINLRKTSKKLTELMLPIT